MMTQDEMMRALEELVGAEPSSLTAESPLEGDHIWDSLVQLSVIALVDEECEKILSAKALRSCKTFGELMALIENAPSSQ